MISPSFCHYADYMEQTNQYIKQFPDLFKGKKIMYAHGFASSGLFNASAPAAFHASNVSRMRGSEFAMNSPSAFA